MPSGLNRSRPRVVILRGHQASPWEAPPWRRLRERFDVRLVETASNLFDLSTVELPRLHAQTVRDRLPAGRIGHLATRAVGDRYLRLEPLLRDADIVHSQELGYWYSAQAARLRARLGFRLVLTVWETLPFLDVYRNVRTRRYRRLTLRHTDLFLPVTERARAALRLEGADEARLRVCPPGIDERRFAQHAASGRRGGPPTVLSAGRLVWEKGHQDVLRAVAALHRGIVAGPGSEELAPRVVVVGTGPERGSLERYARELEIGSSVEFRDFVAHEDMPRIYADSACLVLASIPVRFWEEQFGLVLAEAMLAGLPIVASTSGAIPEVVGEAGSYFAPGDWLGLANRLAGTLTSGSPTTSSAANAVAQRYTSTAAADRLAAVYDELLEGG